MVKEITRITSLLLVHEQSLSISVRFSKEYFPAMDPCFVDVTIEFLGVAFHNILYQVGVYPKSIFEARRKYSMVVIQCVHPEVNSYIDLCLKNAAECLKTGRLNRLELAVTDEAYRPLLKFVFDFDKNSDKPQILDEYLVQCEQNLRAFFLNLLAATGKFSELPENRTFTIYLHTDMTMAVSLTTNPEFEDCPLVEVEERDVGLSKIIPLWRFPIRNFFLDAYIEIT